ncbi:hypothetical protein BGZ98_008508, partial [Dissophora globulifera]
NMKISAVLTVLAVLVVIQAVPIPADKCPDDSKCIGNGPGTPGGSENPNSSHGSNAEPEVADARIAEPSSKPAVVTYKRADKDGDEKLVSKGTTAETNPEGGAEDQGNEDEDKNENGEEF